MLTIVPCYNEEASVSSVVKGIKCVCPEADVLVINDGSTDRTGRVAWEAGARVVSFPYNMGIGAAMQAGYRYALENGYDLAAQVDGDGQHNPEELRIIVEPILGGHADLVVGSRFIKCGGFRSTPMRRLGINMFS